MYFKNYRVAVAATVTYIYNLDIHSYTYINIYLYFVVVGAHLLYQIGQSKYCNF